MSLAAKVKSVSQETCTHVFSFTVFSTFYDYFAQSSSSWILPDTAYHFRTRTFLCIMNLPPISTDGLLYVLSLYTLCNSNLLIDKSWYHVPLYIHSKIFGKCGQYLSFYVNKRNVREIMQYLKYILKCVPLPAWLPFLCLSGDLRAIWSGSASGHCTVISPSSSLYVRDKSADIVLQLPPKRHAII